MGFSPEMLFPRDLSPRPSLSCTLHLQHDWTAPQKCLCRLCIINRLKTCRIFRCPSINEIRIKKCVDFSFCCLASSRFYGLPWCEFVRLPQTAISLQFLWKLSNNANGKLQPIPPNKEKNNRKASSNYRNYRFQTSGTKATPFLNLFQLVYIAIQESAPLNGLTNEELGFSPI